MRSDIYGQLANPLLRHTRKLQAFFWDLSLSVLANYTAPLHQFEACSSMSKFEEPEDIDELRPYMEDGDEDVEVVWPCKN